MFKCHSILFLFIYSLFNDDFSNSDYVWANDKMVNVYRTVNNVVRMGKGLVWETVSEFVTREGVLSFIL
jgi:hypothetical protein